MPTRRVLPALLALVPLIACADPAFDRCLAGLQTQAAAKGVAAADFQRFTAGLSPDPSVLPLLDAQPEFTTPIWDYLASLVDSQRVADGQFMLATHRDLLTRLSEQTGVDPATIVAVWGVESDYGRVTGKRPLLVSLATLSCAGRRQPFFRGEFLALLGLLQQGDLSPNGLTGSWAGAFGQTQFMPSTYARIAVDGDGDGRRDLVASIPDALASTANYLVKAGWERARPWGMEVRLPAGFDASKAGRTRRQPLQAWQNAGLLGTDGKALAPAGLPAKPRPPCCCRLAQPARHSWCSATTTRSTPTTPPKATRCRSPCSPTACAVAPAWSPPGPPTTPAWAAERRELQQLLLARGHLIGEADGMIGTASRRAIQVEQTRLGLQPADGRPGQRILTALRAAPPVAGAAAIRATAFKLPAAYPAFVQSPIVQKAPPMSDLTGLRTGDFHGFPSLLIDTPFSTAAISLFGGQLLSFVPKGGQDVMWLSPTAKQPPTPIRGGAPVCWPYFGRQDQTGEVPAHGFVRTVPWQLTESRREDDGTLVLTLTPPSFDDLALRLRMTLRIGRTLEQSLITENTSPAPVRFTQALHNYFRVGDALKVSVQGLDGLDYLDKYENYATPHRQQGDWSLRDPRDPGRSDRVYTNAGGRYTLTDPVLGRRIVIVTQGSRSLVAWNPGQEAAAKMADVGEGWRDYVCLEAANAGPDVIELAPGASHTLTQTISVE